MAILSWLYLIHVSLDFISIVSCSWKLSYCIATNVSSRKSATTLVISLAAYSNTYNATKRQDRVINKSRSISKVVETHSGVE